MSKPGDVVLTMMQFTDSFEVKVRPAVVLYEDFDNVVVAGITSNLQMKGISLTKADGAIKESVIKLNYIFTISAAMIKKTLFSLSKKKHKEVVNGITQHLEHGL